MWILHIINFLFSWALLLCAVAVNIRFIIDNDDQNSGSSGINLIEIIGYSVINIPVLIFTYYQISTYHNYFSLTSRYFYALMFILNIGIYLISERENIIKKTFLSMPFIIIIGQILILIALKLISLLFKIIGFTIGLTFKVFGFVFSLSYVIIGILIFLYLIILYNVIFRPNSKLASLNNIIKDFIQGIFYPEKVAPKYITKFLDQSGYQSTQNIHDMLKRKRINLTDDVLKRILLNLEDKGEIYQSAEDGWEIVKKKQDTGHNRQ